LTVAAIPECFWELGLGLYLTFKGFRPSPILGEDTGTVRKAETVFA
jgi:hypothetical protein